MDIDNIFAITKRKIEGEKLGKSDKSDEDIAEELANILRKHSEPQAGASNLQQVEIDEGISRFNNLIF